MNFDSNLSGKSSNQVMNSGSERETSEDSRLFGIWAPCITPVDENYAIDVPRLCSLINWLQSNGCHGVSIFGTTGEAASFSAHERMSALEQVLESGISPDQLMVGNGFPAITDTVDVTRHALDLGCSNVLMLPPFYFKNPTIDGLCRSYRYVFDQVNSSDLRVILYHFPRMSTIPIPSPLIDELVRSHDGLIAGLKDSTCDWDSSKDYIERHPQMAIFPGTDALLLKGLECGGAGTITATANVNAAGIREVYDLWSSGESAEKAQQKAETIRSIIFEYPIAAALKFLHSHYRFDSAWEIVRPPLSILPSSDKTKLIRSLQKSGFALDFRE